MASEIDYAELLSERGRGLRSNAIRELTKLLGRREVISLAAGAPSSETLPLAELADISATVIRERGNVALQYGPTKGQPALVDAVVDILKSRGISDAKTSEVVMTSGSQQGLDMIGRVLLDPGDVALVELPSYIGGIIALQNTGAELVGVEQDDDGIVLEDLQQKLARLRERGRRVKCVYTIPNFQNPSGVSLSMARRRELAEIASEQNLLIIEDDAYFDLHFSDQPRITPITAMAPDRVIYLGTFSKVLAPGLRAAYLRAPESIASRVELAKEGADLSSSVLDQAIVMESLRRGLVEKRLPQLRQFYETRRDAMLDALSSFAPKGASWTRPTGGFFILLKLPEEMDTGSRLRMAIEEGVAYVPGESFFVDGSGRNTARLAYSKESPERIRDGIEKMCRVLGQ
jgi:2-aminoadipate transaminase